MEKANARILDATAGNRGIWSEKYLETVVWIDIEPELEITPDIIINCTNTDFEDKQFHTIFFDPPHNWGKDIGDYRSTIRNKAEAKKFHSDRVKGSTYYGWDKYSSRGQLVGFIHRAQEEFQRIIMDDGMLWVKWNEMRIPWRNLMPLFKDWKEVLKFRVCSPQQTKGSHQTWWIALMKNNSSSTSKTEVSLDGHASEKTDLEG